METTYREVKFETDLKDNVGGDAQNNIVNWLSRSLKEDTNFIEVGCHVGVISVFATKLLRTGKALLYEPNPDSFRMLNLNLEKNNCTNYKAFEKAVWRTSDRETFWLNESQPAGSNFFFPGGVETTVETTTIDDEVAYHKMQGPIVMKIDAEYSEPEIWKGMRKSLPLIQEICMEFNHGALKSLGFDPDTFLKEIVEAGFRVSALDGREWDYEELITGKKDLLLKR